MKYSLYIWRRSLVEQATQRARQRQQGGDAGEAGGHRDRNSKLGAVAERLATRTTEEWRALIDAADVPNGAMNSLADILRDPHLADIDFFHRFAHPSEGATVLMRPAPHFSESPASLRRGAPRLGEHTREVLDEAGLSAVEIAALT